MGIQWNLKTPWRSLESRGTPWNSMELSGTPWNSMKFFFFFFSMEFHGIFLLINLIDCQLNLTIFYFYIKRLDRKSEYL
jgi:hypothetical protein